MDDRLDFSILKVARIRTVDAAKLLKLSRVTVSLWVNGKAQPHSLVRTRVLNFLDAVEQAMQAGSLPVPFDVGRRERGFYVQRVLGAYFETPLDAP